MAVFVQQAGSERSEQIMRLLTYFAAGMSVAVHLFVWFTYAALASIVCRFVLPNSDASLPIRTSVSSVGVAHIPLLVWAVATGIALWWLPPSELGSAQLVRIQTGTRLVAYACSLMVFTGYLCNRYPEARSAAVVAAWLPALILVVLFVLLNVATGAA